MSSVTVSNACSPPKKRAKKSHINLAEKQMILNVYKSESLAYPDLIIDEIMKHVAMKTGVCTRTVYNIVKEYKNNRELSAPKTNMNRKLYFLDSIEDIHKTAIHRKVHEFYFRNEVPTVKKVLRVVNEDIDLPNFKRTTFYKFVNSLNFEYKKLKQNIILLDKEEIILWRRDYLKKIKFYRREDKKMYFLDETWINSGHTVSVESSKQAFMSGLSTGLESPSGKGNRLIICHIGSEDGFVPDALWAFESKKSGDIHEEIDGKSFENWFSQILPKLDEHAVIVMDNASYHSRKIENIPTSSSSKADIKNWLSSKNINFKDDLLKVELLAIVKKHKDQYNKYCIDEMARSQNKIILRLPPYHCELNPIELIWAQIKYVVAMEKTSLKFDLKNLLHKAVGTITPEKWQKCIQDSQQVEEKMWKLDNFIETHIEAIIISANDDSSSDLSD